MPVYAKDDGNKDFIDGLMIVFFRSVDEYMDKKLKEIADDQVMSDITSVTFTFKYGGRNYTPLGCVEDLKRAKTLHKDFEPAMDQYVLELEDLMNDKTNIKQILFRLLYPCKSLQDARDALPDLLVNQWEDIKNLPRLHSEAWTLLEDPRGMRQYKKSLDKMHFYAVHHLFF